MDTHKNSKKKENKVLSGNENEKNKIVIPCKPRTVNQRIPSIAPGKPISKHKEVISCKPKAGSKSTHSNAPEKKNSKNKEVLPCKPKTGSKSTPGNAPEKTISKNKEGHRRFKKKPWQKFNPRTNNGLSKEDGSSSSGNESENENQVKYRKRQIVDNSSRFEKPEEETIEGKVCTSSDESSDYSDLFEAMRLREQAKSPVKDTENIAFALPEDFESTLDVLLALKAPGAQQESSPSNTDHEDPQDFSKWLDNLLDVSVPNNEHSNGNC